MTSIAQKATTAVETPTTYDFTFSGAIFNGKHIKTNNDIIIVSTDNMDTNLYGKDGYYKCLLNGKIYQRKKQINIYGNGAFKEKYSSVHNYSEYFYNWLEDNCLENDFCYYEPRYNRLKFNQYVDGNLEINYWLDDINDMCKGKTYHQIYKEVMLGSGDGKLRSFILSMCAGSWWEYYNDVYCLKVN